MTKPTKWLCAQRRLRSAWASAQTDQSSLCAQWVAKDPSFLHADSEDWSDWVNAQAGWMPRLIWIFAGRTCCIVRFVMRRLIFFTIVAMLLLWFILIVNVRPLSVCLWLTVQFIQDSIVAICLERTVPLAFHLCCFYLSAVLIVGWNSLVSIPAHCQVNCLQLNGIIGHKMIGGAEKTLTTRLWTRHQSIAFPR